MNTYTQDQAKKIYQEAINKGLDGKKVMYLMAKQGAIFSGANMDEIIDFGQKTYEVSQPEQPEGSDLKSDIKQTGQGIKKVFEERSGKIQESIKSFKKGEQSYGETAAQSIVNVVRTPFDVAGELIKGGVKGLLSQEQEEKLKAGVGEVAGKAIETVSDLTSKYENLKEKNPTLAGGINIILGYAPEAVVGGKDLYEKYQELKETNPRAARNMEAVFGVAETALDLATLGTGKVATTALKETGEQALEAVIKAGGNVAKTIVSGAKGSVGEIVQKSPEILAKFIAPDVDPKFATALKRTTKAEVDDMESIVKNAVENTDNPSAFEIVGNKLADATEQVSKQVKSLSQQKNTIISKAKNGLSDFTKETSSVILDINRALKDSNLAKSFISRLKQVKTKIDADKAIDELQDILYKGNKDMTLPVGSKEDIVLKAIIGKYNSALKEGLPSAYKKLNESISNKLSNLELLNKSLGEVVDGVPIRGASLIKQYFSPAGTKAKELFEFIKNNTGYDVGKDSVLAKYISEIYGETRAKSLLQGIPTTAQGTLDKLLGFTLEKTGVAGKVKALKRKGEILKAKELSK